LKLLKKSKPLKGIAIAHKIDRGFDYVRSRLARLVKLKMVEKEGGGYIKI
jgi:hypothetical protein